MVFVALLFDSTHKVLGNELVNGTCHFVDGMQVFASYGFKIAMWDDIFVLVSISLALRAIVLLALQVRARKEKYGVLV